MPGEAIGAEMELVHAAHYGRHFGATEIASTALFGLRLVVGSCRDFGLRGPRFKINSTRT